MTPTTPSPISDQAAGEPIAWLIRWPNGNAEVFMDLEVAKQQAAMFRTKPVPLGVISTAPTTGSAPETDDTFIEAYKVGSRLCSTVHEANKAIVQGHGSSWYPLYRKNHPKAASPEASTPNPVSALESTEDYLARRDGPTTSVLTDVDVEILKAVSAEYNAWIFYHAAGGEFDSFLAERKASMGGDKS